MVVTHDWVVSMFINQLSEPVKRGTNYIGNMLQHTSTAFFWVKFLTTMAHWSLRAHWSLPTIISPQQKKPKKGAHLYGVCSISNRAIIQMAQHLVVRTILKRIIRTHPLNLLVRASFPIRDGLNVKSKHVLHLINLMMDLISIEKKLLA